MNCQQICNFSCKKINQSENIPKSFGAGGGYFLLKHPVQLPDPHRGYKQWQSFSEYTENINNISKLSTFYRC